MDCNHCGKRVAKSAERCGHCGFRPAAGANVVADEEPSEEHHSTGGYDDAEDDFDYDEFTKEEFDETPYGSTKRNLWWYVAVMLLVMIAITAVLPLF